jgi:hypothetical protein
MKTKTINLYEFDELSEDVKEKVLDNERYINVDDSHWYDYEGHTGFTSKELKRMRVDVKDAPDELITWKNLYFDLDRGWYIQFTDAQWKDEEIARKFLRVPKKLWERVEWSFENANYGGNCHGTTKLEFENSYWDDRDFTDKQAEILERAVEIFSDKMEEALKCLRSQYEWSVSDEAIEETILANDYTFTIDGNMEN